MKSWNAVWLKAKDKNAQNRFQLFNWHYLALVIYYWLVGTGCLSSIRWPQSMNTNMQTYTFVDILIGFALNNQGQDVFELIRAFNKINLFFLYLLCFYTWSKLWKKTDKLRRIKYSFASSILSLKLVITKRDHL